MTQGAFWNNYKNTARPATTTISTPSASGANVGYRGTATNTNVAVDPFIADLMAMSDADRLAASQLLVNAGYLRRATKKYNKEFGDAYSLANMDLSTESARTGRPNLTLRQFLLENAAAPGGTAEKVPTRQVYNIRPEQIAGDIDELAVRVLGRTITDADKEADWYQDLTKGIQKLYRKGTLSEPSKIVVNPKTGKKERLTAQTPEFSKEQITERITTALETADPMAVERKKNLEFANWAIQKMGGGR